MSESERQSIFETFWGTSDWSQRKVFVCSHVDVAETKTLQTQKEISRRQSSLFYHLPHENMRIPVCRNMFLQTLNIGYRSVQDWVKNASHNMIPSGSAPRNQKKKPSQKRKSTEINFMEKFIDEFPKLPSHYQRANTSKLFLETNFNTIQQLFECYKKMCTENSTLPVSKTRFSSELKTRNISLYQLRKDQCDICTQYKFGTISQDEYNQHQINKIRARTEMNADKKLAENGKCILLTMDLQSVKICPSLQVSAAYYKTKLACHNFSIFDLGSHHATCYWFTETEGSLVASAFVSCIIDYITRHCASKVLPIVIYSDGCTYQNRNTVLSNSLLHCAEQLGVSITQKYLTKGHTQMECDSIHSCIERKLKNRDIYLPSDYIRITKEARINPFPYEVVELDYTFFKDYTKNAKYASIRPGRKPGDPTVTDIKCLLYDKGSIKYKLDYNDEFKDLPIRQKNCKYSIPTQLHLERIPIKKQKWEHLQQLKEMIPSDCRSFYDILLYT